MAGRDAALQSCPCGWRSRSCHTKGPSQLVYLRTSSLPPASSHLEGPIDCDKIAFGWLYEVKMLVEVARREHLSRRRDDVDMVLEVGPANGSWESLDSQFYGVARCNTTKNGVRRGDPVSCLVGPMACYDNGLLYFRL